MMKLLIGGSPCTHWSIAQTKNRETEPSGIGWELFKNYLIALEKYKPDFFLYENNKSMSAAIRAQITKEFGFEPVLINSALVSAQSRQRLYWVGKREPDGTYSRVPVEQPEDKGILLRDILESGVCWREKAYCPDSNYWKTLGRNVGFDTQAGRRKMVEEPVSVSYQVLGRCRQPDGSWVRIPEAREDGKAAALTTVEARRMVAVPVRVGTIESDTVHPENDSQQYRVFSPDGKSVTLCGQGGGVGAKTGLYAVPCCEDCPVFFVPEATAQGYAAILPGDCVDMTQPNSKTRRGQSMSDKSNCLMTSCQYYQYLGTVDKPIYEVRDGRIAINGKQYPIKLVDGYYIIRKLTVTECKRLQTVPEDYVFPVSPTQAYKMLGNGWTVDVIAHILSHVPGISTEPLEVLSMYDGMSCGHIALDKLGGHIVKYYATEIDNYAIQTTQHNFPDTIQLGDAFQVRDDVWKIESAEPEEAVAAPAVIRPREAQQPQAVGMSNAVIKYPGAKWGVAPWVISHFPEHRSYLEPFFGSGAVLFTKSRSSIETVSDIDGEIVNLFEWIKNDPERLAHEIYFTPYARAEYDRAWAEQYTEKDSFKRAVNFYIRMMQGHGFRTTGEKVGWKNDVQGREAAYAAKSWCKTPEIIMEAAERLRGVQIENRPAVELIRRVYFSKVLIFAHPPHFLSPRHMKKK